jgi:protocatechuate 3,4-dioxygenase beta subunit
MTLDAVELTRRGFLQATLIGGAVIPVIAKDQSLVVTDPDDEGPFYKAGAPMREEIFDKSTPGTRLEVTGRVLSVSGQPIPGAIVDVWNASPEGVYDLAGYHLRGKVKSDSKGRYRFVTIRPAPYVGRTAHLHMMVGGQQHRTLTTQLYFKGEPLNYKDAFVRPSRVISVRSGDVHKAEFDFVLAGA